jgi:hypothetical protein
MWPISHIRPRSLRSSSKPRNEHGIPSEQARAIVKQFYEGAARADITSFSDSLAEDFELFVPPQLPWGGTFDKKQLLHQIHAIAA